MSENTAIAMYLPHGRRETGCLLQLNVSKEIVKIKSDEDSHWQGIPVKPFAVTQDIELGDELTDRDGNTGFLKVIDNKSKTATAVLKTGEKVYFEIDCHNFFKVLGEIQADFIKDGESYEIGELTEYPKKNKKNLEEGDRVEYSYVVNDKDKIKFIKYSATIKEIIHKPLSNFEDWGWQDEFILEDYKFEGKGGREELIDKNMHTRVMSECADKIKVVSIKCPTCKRFHE